MSATEIATLMKNRIHQQKALFKLYNNIIEIKKTVLNS